MRVVVAPDKFKGTAAATGMAHAMAQAVDELGHVAIAVPMADGGDGTLDVLGGANRTTTVAGPNGQAVDAQWRLSRQVAVIEMALASGLVLAGGAEGNDPLEATTRGTGQLIDAAVARGARRIIVGLGGSATTDGGLGALEALGSPARLGGVSLEIATDVRTKFVDAARVFGPQKGATPAQVNFLESRLRGLAQQYRDAFGVDVEDVEGGGAAGGLGGGLFAFGGRIMSGFELVSDELGLYEELEQADVVITGEGRLDNESFDGKVVGGIAEMANDAGVRMIVIAGVVADDLDASQLGDATIVSLSERFGPDRAIAHPLTHARQAITEVLHRESGD